MFSSQKELEEYRAYIRALEMEAYAEQQKAILESPFVRLSELIDNGDRFSHHWKKMIVVHGDISVKYEVSYHSWGNPYGFVSFVESSDGQTWRGTEGRTASGSIGAIINK